MTTFTKIDCPTVVVASDNPLFESAVRIDAIEDRLFLVSVALQAPRQEKLSGCRIEWSVPAADVHAMWHPGSERSKAFQVDWGSGFQSKSTSLAPIASLYNLDGRNRLTFAFSDALNEVTLKAGIHEEDSTFLCSVTLSGEALPPTTRYEAVLRIDLRDIRYDQAIGDVAAWWETLPGLQPSPVPSAALLPMYSTWYSYHQQLASDELERQASLAQAMGCDSIIVDDGWQTDDNSRGYAYTGDWEVYRGKIPDMKEHVDSIHRLGLKYLLWYSVPFVGTRSRVWSRFENKLLRVDSSLNAGVLDPRYPDVREYLIRTYERAVAEWGIDGLKLDFVDSFSEDPDQPAGTAPGRDCLSVPEAVDRLLSDVMERLRAIKPDIMIEFRQTYIGPLMRKYGNIFRATDCPNDSIQNRIRTLDLRLLSGRTAVHSDMIMFNPHEPTESAAMQMINILFSVPQISMRLNELGDDHLDMLRFWLAFCREQRDVLLRGDLSPRQPELLYPLVSASKDDKRVVAVYADIVVPVERPVAELFLVNGTYNERLVLRPSIAPARYQAQIKDCRGRIVSTQTLELGQNLIEIAVPKAGLVALLRTDSL
ncbi:glycoside hydrolase family 36 protein [Cohnella cellulosilytica]|uniref:Glycoside hydrolase family 36 protein n=1 Tax=Cohnella cellulosilytica TaxID=986710 RepID=A0ABW2FMP4_9BACL